MPRCFVVGWNMVNVNVRKKASVARADRAPRRVVGERLGVRGQAMPGCMKGVSPFSEEQWKLVREI